MTETIESDAPIINAMEKLRSTPLPYRMVKLPRDHRGFPIPRFVHYIDGKPDFRVVEPGMIARCIRYKVCWICGEPLGRFMTFVIGPMCAVNRTSSEPPCHHDCAVYAATVCPFLTMPKMRRQDHNMPEHAPPPGFMIARNPGVALLWTTRQYGIYRVDNGVLFEIGKPHDVRWLTNGRASTAAEVAESMRTGLPALLDVARTEGQEAIDELDRRLRAAAVLTPGGRLPADLHAMVTL